MPPVRVPGILRRLFPEILWSMPPGEKKLYLSFDDGPTPVITEKVLDILAAYGARATFFCIGRNAERHPGLLQRILDEGHAVGNHTYSHLKGWYSRNPHYFADISLCAQFVPSALYRPGYGMITPSQVRHLRKQYKIVLWDVMSYDFDPNTRPETCLGNVLRYARPGSVIVFHDSVKASEKVLYALPRVLEHFRERGFGFEGIPHQRPLLPHPRPLSG